MSAPMCSVKPGVEQLHPHHFAQPSPVQRPQEVPLPETPLLAHALQRVDWSDAYAVAIPCEAPRRDPQEWVDAVFRDPPLSVRVLFGVRELLVRLVGIEPGGRHVFDTVARRTDEVLVGVDQRHLSYRASLLVERERVVLSTVVERHDRRGTAYFALVRRVHPFVVRTMLARAAHKMAVAS